MTLSKKNLTVSFASPGMTDTGTSSQRRNAGPVSNVQTNVALMPLNSRINRTAAPSPRAPFRPNTPELEDLFAKFHPEAVNDRLRNDTHVSLDSLHKQLQYEAKKGITLEEFSRMCPYDGERHATQAWRNETDPPQIEEVELISVRRDGQEIGTLRVGYDGSGRMRSQEARGAFGVPDGWRVDDKLTIDEKGVKKLRTIFISPNGETGKVVRTFDRDGTMVIDKEYKLLLPGTLAGVPGFTDPVPTVNYMTARTMSILGVDSTNLRAIKGSRMQNQRMVGHMHWLMTTYPDTEPGKLVHHTSWAKNAEAVAAIAGLKLEMDAEVITQDSKEWAEAHPGAIQRDWDYPQLESTRLAIKHLTGQKIGHVGEDDDSWKARGEEKLAAHYEKLRELPNGESLIAAAQEWLAAVDGERARIERRYGIDPAKGPRIMNFDVIFRTIPNSGSLIASLNKARRDSGLPELSAQEHAVLRDELHRELEKPEITPDIARSVQRGLGTLSRECLSRLGGDTLIGYLRHVAKVPIIDPSEAAAERARLLVQTLETHIGPIRPELSDIFADHLMWIELLADLSPAETRLAAQCLGDLPRSVVQELAQKAVYGCLAHVAQTRGGLAYFSQACGCTAEQLKEALHLVQTNLDRSLGGRRSSDITAPAPAPASGMTHSSSSEEGDDSLQAFTSASRDKGKAPANREVAQDPALSNLDEDDERFQADLARAMAMTRDSLRPKGYNPDAGPSVGRTD